jgi:Tfp pilus assembly protein PilE
MTRRQAVWAIGIGVAAVAALLAAYGLALPLDASWKANRIAHHAWQGLVGLAGIGGAAWLLVVRPDLPRRDLRRQAVRRRAIALVAVVVAAVLVVVAGELWRDRATRPYLDAARPALAGIHQSASRYREAHGGRWPESLEALGLAPAALRYDYRRGPVPSTAAPGPSEDPPAFALARVEQPERGQKPRETTILAYLKPPAAWAPLTAVVYKSGRIEIVGEDVVERFEAAAKAQSQAPSP